ncbi:hypothetical protein COU49_02510 [Candidatus Nomurabacteria bacterium CG10_big_fil_rev_8_21_14_0_10_35_16]|uniref:Helix-turn-helix domain-containing protein n=1 Tax=Candidatus Nomurabacteria bacterium CG10_big_fil_rev_8_21_14_0_10_35_16 TaxID=1974731 RepID=A0A2H0TCS9_9BACT|nr:MAG: hypothetical protein COU49_02510 [Candidatus Nomurabacteria bacterium CG10_big_fil_rev_8_21_14_0_10_35_16]
MAKQKFLTLKEVSKILRVSERSMHRYIHSGKLHASKVGYWRISKGDLDTFIKKNSNSKKK